MAHTTATPTAGPSLRTRASSMASTTMTDNASLSSSRQRNEKNLKQPAVNVQVSEFETSQNHLVPEVEHEGESPATAPTDTTAPWKPTFRFWIILVSLAVIAICGTMEATVIINVLPTIAADLRGGSNTLWVPNAFFLASVAMLPLWAQLSDIFGRRNLLLVSTSMFILGCGLCGGSTSMSMLIASRTVQGCGSGGLELLVGTVITDLAPLRETPKYMSVVLMGSTVGSSLGPFVGGLIVNHWGWRWIFYINVVLGSVALVLFIIFLKLKHSGNKTLITGLRRIDIGGNAIFIGSVIAVLLAVTWGGPIFQWDSYHVLVPLTLGLVGFFAFTAFEWTPRLAPEPSFPRVLVSNRTSAAAFFMTFVLTITTMWVFYFFPVYFQGILAKSPLGSGIAILPISACSVPFAVIAGVLLSQFGRYKIMHGVGWSVLMLGLGLTSMLNRNSSTAAWVCFQIICAVGVGILTPTLLPAIQAPLDQKHVATSTALWSFARGFGAIWGVTIPSTIFNNRVSQYAGTISDSRIASLLAKGGAYDHATQAFLNSVPDPVVRDQVIDIFTRALEMVWYVGIAFAGLGFLAVFVQKEIKLRQELETEFGLQEEDEDAEPRATTTTATEAIPLQELSWRREP